MKTYFLSAFATLSLFITLFSCSTSEEDQNLSVDAQIQQINVSAKTGTWKISSYVDSGNDETNHFTGYSFTFNESGELSATNGTNTYTGTWSVTKDDSSDDDSPDDDVDFNIFFASPDNFADLSDDWDIVSVSSTKIDLIDISGGNGGTDTLTFIKN